MRLLAILTLPALLTSCTLIFVGRPEVMSHAKASSISQGMSREQVQEVLGGQPSVIEFLDGGEVAWIYYRGLLRGVNFGIISANVADVASLAVVFDAAGTVTRIEGVPLEPKPYVRRQVGR